MIGTKMYEVLSRPFCLIVSKFFTKVLPRRWMISDKFQVIWSKVKVKLLILHLKCCPLNIKKLSVVRRRCMLSLS